VFEYRKIDVFLPFFCVGVIKENNIILKNQGQDLLNSENRFAQIFKKRQF